MKGLSSLGTIAARVTLVCIRLIHFYYLPRAEISVFSSLLYSSACPGLESHSGGYTQVKVMTAQGSGREGNTTSRGSHRISDCFTWR